MRISVIIPTKNRLGSLKELLESLAGSDPPEGGHEVVVVNDGGEDIGPLARRYGVRAVRQNGLGVATARNRGVVESAGRVLLFTDDDCRVEPSWMERMSRRLEQEQGALVMGRVVNGLEENVWAETNQRLHDVVVEWFNAQPDSPGFFTGNNFAIRREDWEATGGMRADWQVCGGEEREFAARWAARGGRVVMESSAVVKHYHALTAGKFLDQQFRYGRGAWFARGTRPRKTELYGRILTAAPDMGGRARLWLSQAAVATGWAYEAVLGRKQKAVSL